MQGTNSVGGSMIFWVLGALITMAGVLVFAEFGLTVPRMRVDGQDEKESVPRNGGEKNYVRFPSCPSPSHHIYQEETFPPKLHLFIF